VHMMVDMVLCDGAPACFSPSVWEWLGRNYPRYWTCDGLEAAVLWQPQLPDLTPTDFNLWSSMSITVYANIFDIR
jgi:hypothetical protein